MQSVVKMLVQISSFRSLCFERNKQALTVL
jgi:hypothetical protein